MTIGRRASILATALLLTGCSAANAGTVPGPSAGASAPLTRFPAVSTYDLGNAALRVPGFPAVDPVTGAPDPAVLAPVEVTAVVHHPGGAGPYPLAVLLHDARETCADRDAGAAWERAWAGALAGDRAAARALDAASHRLTRWPCAAGVEPIPSHRGLDHLGERLAAAGVIAVSVSANGVSAGYGPAQDAARAALIDRHLELWRSAPPAPGADLGRVVTVGHGRGGDGVVRHAAQRSAWPPGVTVRGVVALGPGYAAELDSPGAAAYRTDLPVTVATGGCDAAGLAGAENVAALNPQARRIVVRGGNRTFVNTQAAPSSGQVLARDDVATAAATGTGVECAGRLTETAQRDRTASIVVSAVELWRG